MSMLNIDGSHIYYEVHGNGLPLLFIHTHGLSQEMFFPQIHYFSKHYKLILVDLRGNGQSGVINVTNDEILVAQCKDIAMLLEHLKIPKAALVGISDGGVLVQMFSNLYADKVSAIVLVDSYSHIPAKGLFGKCLSVLQTLSWSTYYLPATLFLRSLKVTYYRWDLAYSTLRNEMLRKRPTEWIKQRIALKGVDCTSYLPHIKVPALCIVGDFSSTGIPLMQEVARLIPNAKLHVIEDSFDPSNLCQPLKFNQIVMEFIESHRLKIEKNSA